MRRVELALLAALAAALWVAVAGVFAWQCATGLAWSALLDVPTLVLLPAEVGWLAGLLRVEVGGKGQDDGAGEQAALHPHGRL